MDPLYRRRIPTGHVSFDELYMKFFGDIPEEQNSRISQIESFESLYQKYHDNAEDVNRQRIFDELYLKYADELQVFSGRNDSIDFVYTLIDNSSNVSDTTLKQKLISPPPQEKSNITPSQKGNDNMTKMNSIQKIDDSLIPPPVTNPPHKEKIISSEIKQKSNSSSFSPNSSINQVPEKIRTRSSTRLNSCPSPKIPKIISNTQTGSSRVLRNHRSKSLSGDVDKSPTVITPTDKSGKKLIDTLKYRDNNSKKSNSKGTNGAKKFSLVDGDDNVDDHPKKKVKKT